MKKRFTIGSVINGVTAHGKEAVKKALAPAIEEAVIMAAPIAEEYPLWEDPDSLSMMAIIRANHKRHK